MAIIISLNDCKAIPMPLIIEILSNPKRKIGGGTWTIVNEIKPSDLFCYLFAKYGKPNGVQNVLRQDDSDNLIHWDWTLHHPNGLIMFLGMNLRTEIQLVGKDWNFEKCDLSQLIGFIKRDISQYGKEIKRIRAELFEDWDVFVNPFYQMKSSILKLQSELDSLRLNPEKDEISEIPIHMCETDFSEKWYLLAQKYEKGSGIAMGIRAMIPVLAESFVNLILFVLSRKDIKDNKRLYENTVRSNIDVKIQSLHINCVGFKCAIDWKSKECTAYNKIVNERNDMLHGNIVIEKQKYDEIFFCGKVPIFKSYKNPWKQTIGVSIEASGINRVASDLSIVMNLIDYILTCLEPKTRTELEMIMNRRDVGLNKKTGRLGILLPEHIADFRMPIITIK